MRGLLQYKFHAVVFDALFNYKLTINITDMKSIKDLALYAFSSNKYQPCGLCFASTDMNIYTLDALKVTGL
jgi:hypothetical protein